ncbi:MAG TPA: J domain-containing protein [Trichocoleus sp.]
MPQPDSPKTHYQLLGVKPTASAQQIRRAYRDLSKLYHPDTTDLPAAIATEKFQQLNEAYATLSSPERRFAYDQQMGYSRIAVIRPPADLNTPASVKRREYRSSAYLDPTDRPLSAGEIFALFILGVTFVACLALVVTISLTKGETALAIQPLTPPPVEQARSTPPNAAPSATANFAPPNLGTPQTAPLSPSKHRSQGTEQDDNQDIGQTLGQNKGQNEPQSSSPPLAPQELPQPSPELPKWL